MHVHITLGFPLFMTRAKAIILIRPKLKNKSTLQKKNKLDYACLQLPSLEYSYTKHTFIKKLLLLTQ